MQIQRTITVSRPIEEVFAFLSDFETTEQWDPGTVSTTRVSGDGGVGTHYHNVSRFLGRETELDYVVEEVTPTQRFRIRGTNETVVATDTMTFTRAGDDETTVTYHANFQLKGLARLAAPLLGPAFRRLGDEAEVGLRDALERD